VMMKWGVCVRKMSCSIFAYSIGNYKHFKMVREDYWCYRGSKVSMRHVATIRKGDACRIFMTEILEN
jgi:hypothetical protein